MVFIFFNGLESDVIIVMIILSVLFVLLLLIFDGEFNKFLIELIVIDRFVNVFNRLISVDILL